ncbi:MAG TPA: ABC transporter permease subunit [Pirellulales bacterium]|jgi:phosphate transport system permease protein
MSKTPNFTGRRRQRVTRWTVALNDRLARWIIAIGGIGTIVAVSMVCVFLVWVVIPLFLPAEVKSPKSLPPLAAKSNGAPSDVLALGSDEHRLTGWMLTKNGGLRVFRLDTGETIDETPAEKSPLAGVTAASIALDGQSAAFGFEDGKVRLGTINYEFEIISADKSLENSPKLEATAKPDATGKLADGEVRRLDDGSLVTRTEQGEFRRQKLTIKLQPPLELPGTSPIVKLDHVTRRDGTRLCTLSADGKLRINLLTITHNSLTEEDDTELTGADLPLKNAPSPPDYVLVSELGDAVYAAWRDGRLLRYITRDVEKPRLAEDVDLVPENGHSLTALTWLLGRNTLIAGDTLGRVRGWFTREVEESGSLADDVLPPDGRVLTPAHEFAAEGHAVTSIAASPRQRLVAAGFDDGKVRLLYVSAERMLADLKCTKPEPVSAVSISPKGNCLLASTAAGVTRWDFDTRYPEATLSMLFLPVWYEGRTQPEHAWQSTGASDASEAKLGLMPLVFGTLKATFYTMLFGAPLALLAALYSSEFLHPRLKARVKPTIEMMASLPSVVLGFLAGLVVAPFIENYVPEALTCIFTIPFAFLCGAYLWQLLPSDWVVRLSRFRLLFIMLLMPLGILAGIQLGPSIQRWLFAGNLKQWLDQSKGSGIGGWVLLLLPLSGLFTAVLFSQQVNPWLRGRTMNCTRLQAGLIELCKFVTGTALTIAAALVLACALDALKLDPRGSLFGTYVQRNALIVGFAMGFAIIPLIYTIADDALSTVPEHLRSASLGAGATPWQTAVRIVVPTAASGLFSALMIGLGRAVGETMIVLMAAGNTPVMKWNIFEGFETLSMAIATELPEAARNSTHYRTLFLAAFTLFAITFVVNTVAEMVRQRFRRRAYEL